MMQLCNVVVPHVCCNALLFSLVVVPLDRKQKGDPENQYSATTAECKEEEH
jgi:hypothetical protein